jgi:hypothetical protein
MIKKTKSDWRSTSCWFVVGCTSATMLDHLGKFCWQRGPVSDVRQAIETKMFMQSTSNPRDESSLFIRKTCLTTVWNDTYEIRHSVSSLVFVRSWRCKLGWTNEWMLGSIDKPAQSI